MAKDRHLAASDRAEENRKKRRTVSIILSILIFIMAAAVIAEVIVLKSMTSVDRRFIRGLERGVAEGWETGKSDLQLRQDGTVTDTAFLDREYEAVAEFRGKPYQDKELRKLARRYIDDLRKCRAAAEAHDPSEDSEAFWAEFSAPYTDRLVLLRKFHTGDYRMGSSWESYPEQLSEVMLRGWAVETAESLRFDVTETEGGIKKFTAHIKNNSGLDIAYLNVDIELYDSSDGVVGTAEAVKENIRNGSAAELVFYCSAKDVSSYRAVYADCVPEIREDGQE